MKAQAWARSWFGLTALAVAAGLAINLFVTATNQNGRFPTAQGRIFNQFTYFTIQSNLIVGVTCLLPALNLHRTSLVFRVFRLTGLVDIAITGVVYHIALAHLYELTGHAAVGDFLVHTAVPILCVSGWLVFGPRRLTSVRVVMLAILYPIGWLAFTLIRGAVSGYYPYPFIDAGALGSVLVLRNMTLITLLFLALAFGAAALDRWLALGKAGAVRSRTATY